MEERKITLTIIELQTGILEPLTELPIRYMKIFQQIQQFLNAKLLEAVEQERENDAVSSDQS